MIMLVASSPAGQALAGFVFSADSSTPEQGLERAFVPRIYHSNSVGPAGAAQQNPEAVNPLAAYKAEPAPMGIADFGIGPSGAYQYASNSSLGSVYISSLSTSNATGGTQASLQLNVNLHFTANNKQYVYWVQDVAVLDTRTNLIYFMNNVWNSSVRDGSMVSAGISGNGAVRQSHEVGYYVAVAKISAAGNDVNLKYPSQIYFRVNSSLSASRQPQVTFEYSDGYGWVTFDKVTFTSVTKLTSLPGFVVSGFGYNPSNFDNAELVIGGPHSGASTSDVSSDIRFQLEYWNGHNYQMIQNAYNFGADTAETISNVQAKYYYYPNTGEIISDLFQGAGSPEKLYDLTRVGIADVKLGLQSGVLYVRNSSAPATATQAQHPFVNGEVILVLYPGNYSLQAYDRVGGTLYKAGSTTLSGGQSAQPLLGLIGIKLGYLVKGGGSGYQPPSVTYVYGGQKMTAPVGTDPSLFLMDEGASWSIPTSLAGSSPNERWLAPLGGGVASSSQSMNVTYYHQFFVPVSYGVVGGGSPSPPVFSYSSAGTASSLTLSASPQSVWMDDGVGYTVTSALGGSDSRERWSPAGLGGAGIAAINGASPLTISYRHQFYLAAAPPAGSSSDWFDAGSTATLSTQAVFGRGQDTGQRIVSYSVDNGQSVAVTTAAGTVSASVLMDSPHNVAFNSVSQYRLTVVGGSGVTLSSASPTSDDFFDAGSSISVSTQYSWAGPQWEQQRLNLLTYSVDGSTTNVPRSGSGVFTTPQFKLDGPKSVAFNPVTQYLVSFTFTGASTAGTFSPSVFRVATQSLGDQSVVNGSVWLDEGSSVSISSLQWEGSDVKPDSFTLVVNGPENPTVHARVYDLRLKVADPLGLPISGADARITLANGTSLARSTSGDGMISIPMIPLGTFDATVSSLGQSVKAAGDAAAEPMTSVQLTLSYPVVGLALGALALASIALVLLRRRAGKPLASS